ncbi:MAG: hypothetical protein HUJ53_08485 [Holdemanella sp.]|nr:hypothetical protein [Holdemanella sp.]
MIKQLKYKELLKPLGILLGLSFIYNLGVLILSSFIMDYIVQTTLCLFSSIGLYILCSKIWDKKAPIAFKQLIHVLIIEMIWLIFVFVVLEGLNQLAATQVWADILNQMIGAILILFAIPFELLYFYQLHLQKTNVKDIFKGIKECISKNGRTIFNTYCFILIFIVVVDTLTGGLMSVIHGLDTYQMFSTMTLFGNPLMNCMMQMFLIAGMGLPILEYILSLAIFFFIGLWVGLLELNYIDFIKRKCEE